MRLGLLGLSCLRIGEGFRKHSIQPFVVSIDIVEKVHSTIFLRDSGDVEKKDWNRAVRLICRLSLPESIAVCTRATVHVLAHRVGSATRRQLARPASLSECNLN